VRLPLGTAYPPIILGPLTLEYVSDVSQSNVNRNLRILSVLVKLINSVSQVLLFKPKVERAREYAEIPNLRDRRVRGRDNGYDSPIRRNFRGDFLHLIGTLGE